ncbi:CsgE family curli-type amyloid fiber assembly protein [Prolixibacter bellariivorans]|nr:CsgE family curli-type amyloid fiber assembly protein [Prolixibacter bellariivorans]
MKKEFTKYFYLAAIFLLILNFQGRSQTFPSGNSPVMGAGGVISSNAPLLQDQDSTSSASPESALYKVPDMYGVGWDMPVDQILSGRHFPNYIYVNGTEVQLALTSLKPLAYHPIPFVRDTTFNKLGNMTFRAKAFQNLLLSNLVQLIKSEKQRTKEEQISVEIDGLVIDETLSKVGRDFYEAFYSKWAAPLDAKDYTIFVKETPPRMNRFTVSIYVNDDEVFSSFLAPREEIIDAYADYAVRQTESYLEQRENVSQTLESPDMAGSGIY